MRFNYPFIIASTFVLILSACGKPTTPHGATTVAAPAASQPTPTVEVTYQASLQDGIVFNKPGYPSFIKEVKGMSLLESTGRWTDGPSAIFVFKEPIQGKINLEISGMPYGANAGKKIPIIFGDQQHEVVFSGKTGDFETVTVGFDLTKPSDTLEIRIPEPTIPPGGDRKLGIALSTLKIK